MAVDSLEIPPTETGKEILRVWVTEQDEVAMQYDLPPGFEDESLAEVAGTLLANLVDMYAAEMHTRGLGSRDQARAQILAALVEATNQLPWGASKRERLPD